MAKGTLQIDILGTSFSVQAEEDTSYLEMLLGYYCRVIKQVESGSSVKDSLKTAILAGIMLCDELYKEKQKNDNSGITRELSEAERLTLKMIAAIDEALG
jgi:cell division protein ZapA